LHVESVQLRHPHINYGNGRLLPLGVPQKRFWISEGLYLPTGGIQQTRSRLKYGRIVVKQADSRAFSSCGD
jgi:hypothetical protein